MIRKCPARMHGTHHAWRLGCRCVKACRAREEYNVSRRLRPNLTARMSVVEAILFRGRDPWDGVTRGERILAVSRISPRLWPNGRLAELWGCTRHTIYRYRGADPSTVKVIKE